MFYDCRINFKNRREAEKYLVHLMNLAVVNHHVLLSDIYEDLDITVHDGDQMRGWTPTLVKAGNVIKKNGKWTIELPDTMHISELNKHFYRIAKSSTLSDHNILTITIHTNELENPAETLADIFKHIPNIKDRMINITIM